MRVGMNPAQGKSSSFGAISLPHYEDAARDYYATGNIGPSWYNQFSDEVVLYGMTKRDARDTLFAVKQYVNPESMGYFNEFVQDIRRFFIKK